jgi:RNA polymerase-binding protein DksA
VDIDAYSCGSFRTTLCSASGIEFAVLGSSALKGSAPVAKSSSKKTGKSAPPAKKAAAAPAKKSAPVAKKAAPAAKAPAKKVAAKAAVPTRPAPVVATVKAGNGAAKVANGSAKAGNGAKTINGGKKAEKPPINNPFAQQPGEIVLSNAKPKKNLAGLNAKDLEHFRELLLAKRRELVGDMSSMEREALRSTSGSNLSNLPIHMADMGTDNYEQEFTLGLVQKDRDILREINLALAKIQNGTYGICEGTGKPIGKPRLEAKPWARHGIEYARKLETRGVR